MSWVLLRVQTGELEGLWTETDTRTAADTAIDMDSVYGTVM